MSESRNSYRLIVGGVGVEGMMTPGQIGALVRGCIKRTACILLRGTWQCGDQLTIKFHVFARHQRGEGRKTRATFWGLSSLS